MLNNLSEREGNGACSLSREESFTIFILITPID